MFKNIMFALIILLSLNQTSFPEETQQPQLSPPKQESKDVCFPAEKTLSYLNEHKYKLFFSGVVSKEPLIGLMLFANEEGYFQQFVITPGIMCLFSAGMNFRYEIPGTPI